MKKDIIFHQNFSQLSWLWMVWSLHVDPRHVSSRCSERQMTRNESSETWMSRHSPLCSVHGLKQTSMLHQSDLHFHSIVCVFNWPAFSWNDFCNQLKWFLIWLQDVQLCIIVLSCSHFKWIFKGYFLNHLNKFCCISTKFLLEILGNIFTDDFAKVIFWVILSSNPPQRCLSTTQYNISPPGIPLKTKRHTYLSHQQVDFLLLNNWLKADWRMVSS